MELPLGRINFIKASKVKAFLNGREFVTPDDIKSIAPSILRHRIMLSYEADAREVSADEIVSEILHGIEFLNKEVLMNNSLQLSDEVLRKANSYKLRRISG